jgi:hypothetical protein
MVCKKQSMRIPALVNAFANHSQVWGLVGTALLTRGAAVMAHQPE